MHSSSKITSLKQLLRRQIAWCNKLANKDKSSYYSNLVAENSQDPRKLWRMLHKILGSSATTTWPAHRSDKSLADRFATYFQDKIVKIRDCFPSIDNTKPDLPSSNPAQCTAFSEVSVDTARKILLNSPTKSCLLYSWPTFQGLCRHLVASFN